MEINFSTVFLNDVTISSWRREKLLGRPSSSLSVSKGAVRREGTGSVAGSAVIGQEEMISN